MLGRKEFIANKGEALGIAESIGIYMTADTVLYGVVIGNGTVFIEAQHFARIEAVILSGYLRCRRKHCAWISSST